MDRYDLSFDSVEGPVHTAMFVSRGMDEVGQKEMALGVRLRPGEDPALLGEEIGTVFASFFEAARHGQTVDIGGRTVLRADSKPLLGRPDFLGIVYTEPDRGTRALFQGDGLLAIVVTGREIETAGQVGHTRLLSRLGAHARWFPTPPWSDRDRPEVLPPDSQLKSLVAQTLRIHADASTAWITLSNKKRAVPGPQGLPDYEGELGPIQVHLEVDPQSLDQLQDALRQVPGNAALAVLTGVGRELTRCLTWEPGKTGVQAISDFTRPDDPRCAGNFVLFAPAPRENEARVIEDGFGIVLRPEDWQKIRDAISAGREVQVADSAGEMLVKVTLKRR